MSPKEHNKSQRRAKEKQAAKDRREAQIENGAVERFKRDHPKATERDVELFRISFRAAKVMKYEIERW